MNRTPDEIRAFHFWVQGYPKFYEPIAEAYFPSVGYRVLQHPAIVGRADIQRIIDALFDGEKTLGPEVDARKVQTFLKARKRLQPDLLIERDGQRYLVELKSWGGARTGLFDPATLRSDFMSKPERSAFLLVDQVNDARIAGKVLVVSSRSRDHDSVLATLRRAYNTEIELLYLDEIFKSPELRGVIDRQCRYLDAAIAELKQALGVWPGGNPT
jgi:hypothetical protein